MSPRASPSISEIVPLISRYANSQNKVNGADFAANGSYHQVLEQLSRSVWAPAASGLQRGTHWLYERARGSYADDKASQSTPTLRRKWELENPTLQKFTKTDLAKYEHAWLGLPHFVCLGAEKNFNKLADRMEEDGEPLVDVNYSNDTWQRRFSSELRKRSLPHRTSFSGAPKVWLMLLRGLRRSPIGG